MTGYEHIISEVTSQIDSEPDQIQFLEQPEFHSSYIDLLALNGTYKQNRIPLELSVGKLLVMTARDIEEEPTSPREPYGMQNAKKWLEAQIAHDTKQNSYSELNLFDKLQFRSRHIMRGRCHYGLNVPTRECRNIPDIIDRLLGDEQRIIRINLASLVRIGVEPLNNSKQEAA